MPAISSKWALLIGVDRYHESLGSLKFAGADCRALRETLVSGPLGFPEDQVLLLDDSAGPDRTPTFANIHNTLATWLAAPKENDLVLVYFAGHGLPVGGEACLVPSDATLSTLHTLGIAVRHVQEVMERCKARRKMLVLDTCHSGAGRDVVLMSGEMFDTLAQGQGIYTISSCGLNERSYEWDKVGHGVFSYFLMEALRGACPAAADGRLTADHVYEWVYDRVVKWAADKGYTQNPHRFTKGTGVLVLAETAPDYRAMAEEYRRQMEALQSRLSELEKKELLRVRAETASRLADAFLEENAGLKGAALRAKWQAYAKKRLGGEMAESVDLEAILEEALERQRSPKTLKARPERKHCKVPSWQEFVEGKGPYNAYGWIPVVTLVVFFSVLIGGMFHAAFGVMPIIFLLTSWLVVLERWKNRYRHHCLDLCVSEGDYVQASSFAFAMGGNGIDRAAGGAAIVSAAELAEDNGDVQLARRLYELAAKKWGNPHAKVALERLEASEL